VRHSVAYPDGESISDGYSQRNSNSDALGDAKCHTKCDSDGNAIGDTVSYAKPFGDSESFSYSECHTYAYCYSRRVRFLTRVLEKPSRSLAGDRVAAWEYHLYPGTIAGNPA
jgi:hypothetical protein